MRNATFLLVLLSAAIATGVSATTVRDTGQDEVVVDLAPLGGPGYVVEVDRLAVASTAYGTFVGVGDEATLRDLWSPASQTSRVDAFAGELAGTRFAGAGVGSGGSLLPSTRASAYAWEYPSHTEVSVSATVLGSRSLDAAALVFPTWVGMGAWAKDGTATGNEGYAWTDHNVGPGGSRYACVDEWVTNTHTCSSGTLP